jgi:hypothetical protein
MRPNLGQVDEKVDLSKQVIVRDAPLQTEAVEQRLLHHPPFAHHRRISCTQQKRISARRRDQAEFFNAIGKYRSFAACGREASA